MSEQDNRVSLQFSPYIEEQREAISLLKTLGRKKSSFISKAIKYYLENCPNPEIPGVNIEATRVVAENNIRRIVKEMLSEGGIPPAAVETISEKLAPQKPKKTKKIEKTLPKEEPPIIETAPEPEEDEINTVEAEGLLDMLGAFDEDLY